MRIGTIASKSPVTVNVQGTTLPGNALGSYAPMVGDNVAVLRQDQTWLILGKTTSAKAATPGPVSQAGSIFMSVTAAASATANVAFAWPFTRLPTVVPNINNGGGAVASWNSRAYNVSLTGFTMVIFGPSSTFANVEVQWLAQEYTQ